MSDPSIVEIYSAANAVDAYAVANALEAAGIKAHVEGELSGGFPLGQTICPSVSVWEEDQARAREILEQYKTKAEIASEQDEQESEQEEPSPEELAESAEESLALQSRGRNIVILSPLLGIAGLACISLGTFYAIENHRLLNHYSETAQAKLIDRALYSKWFFSIPQIDNPLISGGGRSWKEYFWKTFYTYEVNGVLHTFEIDRKNHPAPNIMIRYNPENPADYHVGAILHPGWCLFLGCVFGVSALFLAYQFR